MIKIVFNIANTSEVYSIELSGEKTIMQAARLAGIKLESPCMGSGICRKCKVEKSAIKPLSAIIVNGIEQEKYVLACKTNVISDVEIRLGQNASLAPLDSASNASSADVKLDFTRVASVASEASASNEPNEANTDAVACASNLPDSQKLGISLDIGTTTLVLSLLDLNNGKAMGEASALNPQVIYAQDVISRIQMAEEEEGLATLNSELLAKIDEMIAEIVECVGNAGLAADIEAVREIVFSGNTAMLHLATNVNPSSLSQYPYTSTLNGNSYFPATELGLKNAPNAKVYIPPIISSYIGSDISSGILAARLDKLDGITLFIDIGTNGEIILAQNGNLTACSTAAGPAFEGMGIECGARAEEGAIEEFSIDEVDLGAGISVGTVKGADSYKTSYKTIGDVEPKSICGSGLVDIVGQLVAHGIIDKTGRFADEGSRYNISDEVYLSQKDIRQLQLAKGAIRAGIETILDVSELSPEDVDRVLIAGSFGYHLNPENIINITLLPIAFKDKIEFVGNTSKAGGEIFLLQKEEREHMAELTKNINTIELASAPNFQTTFIKCLDF